MFSEHLEVHQTVDSGMIRGRKATDNLGMKGFYDLELVRKGKVIERRQIANGITTDGKNNLLNRWFNQTGTSTNLWYISLIDNSGFSTLAAADLMSSHAGWLEFTDYKRADNNTTLRYPWGQGSASGAQITNASALQFTFTGAGSIYGLFVVTDSTKGGTIGTLWSTAQLNTVLAVLVDDILNINYTLQL